MWSALANLFVLPFLLIISIPLALSASITAFLAFITLFLRALVVYFELSFALLANFFLFPAHSPASAPFLALSAVTTPAVDRSPSRTKHGHHHYPNNQANAQHSNNAKPWHSKESVVEDYFFHHNRPQHGPTLMSSHEVLSSFISGNAERDFEGVGGWRTPLASRKKLRTSSASSVSYNSSEEALDDDDQAWVSINKRLELPSRRLNLASPIMATTVESIDVRHQQPQRPRFHRRSVTTPLFSKQSPSPNASSPAEQATARTQLQTSKSSAGLDSLPSSSFPQPSTSHALLPSSSWHDPPFLMTPTSFGAVYKMVHYPSFASRRRSSGSSSAAAAKATSLTGLGLT